MDVRSSVMEAQRRINDTVRTLHNETSKAQLSTLREMEVRRDEILSAGPVQVARAALEVRQERLRRTQLKAVETKFKREQRLKGSALSVAPSGEEHDVDAGGGGVGGISDGGVAGTQGSGKAGPGGGGGRVSKSDPLVAHVLRLPVPSPLLS